MNTDPQPNMAVISQSDLDRLKYELDMALRSERALLEACEMGVSCILAPETIAARYEMAAKITVEVMMAAIQKAKGADED